MSNRRGVRGPGGPPPPERRPSGKAPQGTPNAFQRASLPLLTWLVRLPRWLVVVVLGLMLFLGLIQTGSLAWLGVILLLLVAAFLGWLTALSWSAIPASGKLLRTIAVLAVVGAAVLKAMGRL